MYDKLGRRRSGIRRLCQGAMVVVALWLLAGPALALDPTCPSGMLGYWRFEEASDLGRDSLGGLHGTNNGAVWVGDGQIGGAARFDGSAGVNIAGPQPLSAYSIAGWIRTSAPAQSQVWRNWIAKTQGCTTPYQLGIGDGRPEPGEDDGPHYIVWSSCATVVNLRASHLDLRDGAWHQVVATFETGSQRVYVDGSLAVSGAYPGALPWTSVDTVIGGAPLGSFHQRWVGDVDEVAIFDRALAPSEVSDLYLTSDTGGSYCLPRLSCSGFEPPLHSYPVTVRGKRALPLKAQLSDSGGREITNLEISSPPVVQVWFDSGDGEADDVSNQALPAGHGDDGNQFVFTEEGKWRYNLNTGNYSSPGTYTVLIESGDASEYRIDPTCVTEFVVK